MRICPPFCFPGMPVMLPEPATMLGSNELALGLTALALVALAGFALYRKLRPAR